jgi:hypothetical protein
MPCFDPKTGSDTDIIYSTPASSRPQSSSEGSSHPGQISILEISKATEAQNTQSPPQPVGFQSQAQSIGSLPSFSLNQGQKKALLIGINYFGQLGQLRGCILQVKNMRTFLQECLDTMPIT